MLKHLFKTRPGGRIGDDLYALAVAQARNPAFYTRLGVEDRIDARFELYTLHVLLLVMRLRDENAVRGKSEVNAFLAHATQQLGERAVGAMLAYEASQGRDPKAALIDYIAPKAPAIEDGDEGARG